jgi:hydroxymethylglutaryl-CoA lyase
MVQDQKTDEVLLQDESLRDGLQIESRIFSLAEKLKLYQYIRIAGIKQIQVGSFVHPKIVPQMADTDELIKTIGKQKDTVVSALILNDKGLDRALACGIAHVCMSVSISDTHSRKNAHRPAAEALSSMMQLIRHGLDAGLTIRANLQCVFGCVYEGAVSSHTVLLAVEKMVAAGAQEINLADTTGMADPCSIRRIVGLVNREFPDICISLHLHDTRGLGLTNMFSGYEAGVRSFDVCTGGLGGCPFVKGAAGNVPTEDAVNMFESIGVRTHIDVATLCKAVGYLENILGRPLPGHMKRVMDQRRN